MLVSCVDVLSREVEQLGRRCKACGFAAQVKRCHRKEKEHLSIACHSRSMTLDKLLIFFALFAVWNAAVFYVYAFDKMAARGGIRRVREDKLILLAIAEGGIGAFACHRLMRHKTRKPPFIVLLPLMAALHLVIVLLIVVFPDTALAAIHSVVLFLRSLN